MAQSLERNRDQSPVGDRPNMSDLRIVLVGKNVSENNKVGNLILNEYVFEKKMFPDDVEEHSRKVEGRNITVINTIHLLKSQHSKLQIAQKVSEFSPPEPHVIILVLQQNDFSHRKRDILPSVLNCFGEQAKKRTMILTTDDEKHAKQKFLKENEFIQQISTECGGHLQLQHTQHSQILQKVDEIITCSKYKETQHGSLLDEKSSRSVCSVRQMREDYSSWKCDAPRRSCSRPEKQKLNLVLCGCNEEMTASMSKLLLRKNTPISAHQQSRSECAWSDVQLYGRLISLLEFPALNQLSEEEVMRLTIHCVSLCDPGVHAFIIIVPFCPLTNEEIAGIEKIQKMFNSFKHFILLFITSSSDEEHATYFIKSSPESQRLISLFGGQYRVMRLKEPENSRQIPELLEYIENKKTEPYSLQMCVKAQENRARHETEEEPMKMEIEKQKLQSEVSDLRIVLLGKSVSENNRVANLILRTDAFERKEILVERKLLQHSKRVGGRLKDRCVAVINSPQLLQPHLSLHQITQTVRECVILSDPGPHVFILVLQHKDFTEEDRYRVKSVLKEFSEEAMERTIVITTDEKTYTSMFSSMIMNNVISQIIAECGGGHLQLDERKPEWYSEMFGRVDMMLKRNLKECLRCVIYEDVKETSVEEEQSRSDDSVRPEEENKENSHKDVGKPEERRDEANFSSKQQMNLVLCGSYTTLTVFVSKLLRGQKIILSHQRESSEECVKKEEKIHGRLISLLELPTLNRLSEEEVMCQTLRCVSLCDPGVHAFIIIVPVGPLNNEDKAEIEKIQRIFYSIKHLILLFTTELSVEGFATDFVKSSPDSQRLISRYGGQYKLMGLNEPENSRQIPELLEYIANMKTEPYSPHMYVKAQENRARDELEEQHKKELSEMENKIKELEEKIQSEGAECEDDQECLRIVLIGRTGNGKSATGNTILGREEFVSKARSDSVTTVCMKGVGEIVGRSVAVVDTPGLFDTTLTNEQVAEEIVKCVSLSSPGPHVFVIVLSVARFTKEETDTMDLIKKIFGPKSAQFSIVLFTRGDDLKDESIEDYVKEIKSAELKKLIRDCGNRFLVFNNRVEQDKSQVIQLLNMIEEVKNTNEGRYFTNSMFEEAEMSIKKKMEEIMKEREREIQTQHEKLRVEYEKEMEELKKKLEEEKRKADEEKIQRENEFRQKEEKLIKDFEEKHKKEQKQREIENQKQLEEEKRKKTEYDGKIEEMKREIENQRLQYEKQQKEKEEEDRKKEEKYRQDQENMKKEQEHIIAELKVKQEEETKKRDLDKKRRNEEEDKERQEWERKIKEAENDRQEIQEGIKRQQREWEDEKKLQMKEQEKEERKRKEEHEKELREKQEELEKMRKRFEREREEERQKIEEERQKQRREREEKEREYEEKKAEIKIYYERLEQERKEEWERKKQEDDERREEERKAWKKMIEDLKHEQEEEIKKREIEEKKRKEREEKERDEIRQKHEEEMKDTQKKHEDEARKQAEESNEFRERKEQHIQVLQLMLEERQKQQELLEELFKHLQDQKEREIKELQKEVEKLCQSLQDQKQKEITELNKQAKALNEHLKHQKGDKIEALQQEVEKLCQSLQDQKGEKIKQLQQEAEKLHKCLQDQKEEHLKNLQKEVEEMKNKPKSLCVIL